MNINIKATGMELTPAISDYVTKKVSALEKYLNKDDESIMAQVEIGRITEHHRSGEVFRAEIHITGGGLDHYVAEDMEDLYAAIDKVQDEMTKVIRRGKGKRFALARKGGEAAKNMLKGFSWKMGNMKGFRKRQNPDE